MATTNYGGNTIPFPSILERLIFIGFSRIDCANANDASFFNSQAGVYGEEGIRITPDGEFVERLPVAIGTVASPNLAVPVTVTVPVVKTTATYERYMDGTFRHAALNDLITVYDDAQHSFQISQVSVSWSEGTEGSGKKPADNFTFKGNLVINQELFDQFGAPAITTW